MKYFIMCTIMIAYLEADLLMEVNPPEIIVGVTRKLSINCSFIRTDISNMAKLFSLVITWSNDTTDQQSYLLASVDVLDGFKNITGVVSGLIDSMRTSYITLTWDNPRSTLTGLYSCEANGESIDGHAVVITKSEEVATTKADVDNLLDVLVLQASTIDFQASQIAELKEQFVKLSSSVNDRCICCERFNKSLQSVYHISDLHNGRRYYLSPVSTILLMQEAEGQCEMMGGYLTEFDNEDEYFFVKNFVRNYPEYAYIYTGGNDENLENNWVNTYSKTPLKYTKWGPAQPNAGRVGNCMLLWKDDDWSMADDVCYKGMTPVLTGYLCEVPE